MNGIIKCNNLSKIYKGKKALDDFSVSIREKRITGVIGRNGAGKTTLLKLIANQLIPSSGEITIDGNSLKTNSEIIKNICLARDSYSTYSELKVKEILHIASNTYENWDVKLRDNLLEKFELPTNKYYKKLSSGMQAMVGLIIGLCSNAEITIFDEPYVGLDAVAREIFYKTLIEEYHNNPRTIILSSHLIEEVEKMFEDVIIINKGKVLMSEEMEVVRTKAVIIEGNEEKILQFIKKEKILNVEKMGRFISISLYGELNKEEVALLENNGASIKPLPLQKLFVHLTSNV